MLDTLNSLTTKLSLLQSQITITQAKKAELKQNIGEFT